LGKLRERASKEMLVTVPSGAEATVSIRDITRVAEMRAVADLEKEVWGVADREVVPVTQLVAAREAGGILLGAFDGETLVGFAYGFPGYEGGRVSIHSHMLAVKPAYRSHHLGYRLKLAQRERALAQGINLMTWTYDPLQCLNAHFNFGKLGVLSDKYRINFYGETTSSFLHQFGTDRLWVSWLLDSERVTQRIAGAPKAELPDEVWETLTPLVEVAADGSPLPGELKPGLAREQSLIEIPGEIMAVQRHRAELAVAWREATRWAFGEAMAAGYLVEEFHRRTRRGQPLGVYLLSREKKLAHFS
jgi:predicted GNAT superfamily acetyltransferase